MDFRKSGRIGAREILFGRSANSDEMYTLGKICTS
jgi:hypothetical protein